MSAATDLHVAWTNFHHRGSRKFYDWARRCQKVIDAGATPDIAELIVKTRGGVKLVGMLSDNPSLLGVVTSKRTQAERAEALRRLAAGKLLH